MRRLRLGRFVAAIAAFLLVAAAAWAEEGPRPGPLHAEIGDREALLGLALKPWHGDLEGMIERRMIRVLVVYDPLYYYLDRFQEKGVTYELVSEFEREANRHLGLSGDKRVNVVFIPVGRDRLLADLAAGIGDITAAGLTVTPEREKVVAFADPFLTDVEELLVSGKDFGPVTALEDLSGREVVVRPWSSYAASLKALNARLSAAGKAPVTIVEADEGLTDGALADLVSSGVYPATVMDSLEVSLWQQIYPDLVVHKQAPLRDKGEIAWAVRKESPKLKALIDRFVGSHKAGTKIGNILFDRYFDQVGRVKALLDDETGKRLAETVGYFKTYAAQYDLDWQLLLAQGFQESRLRQDLVSRVGAVGLMQILPRTAAAPPIGIRDVRKPANNVHAGSKYLRYIIDSYFADPDIPRVDRHLMALAAYNAGPTRVAHLRSRAAAHGLDPNRWFNNVELVVGRTVGAQPVDYVRNIFRYYVAFTRSAQRQDAEALARDTGR